MTKVVFLDIDGFLNTNEWQSRMKNDTLNCSSKT